METIENNSAAGALQHEVNTLRNIVNAALVLLIIATGSLNLFVYKQVAGIGRQVDASDAQVKNASNEFENNFKPTANVFLQNLYAYAQRDPNFAQILARHQVQVAPVPQPQAKPAPGK